MADGAFAVLMLIAGLTDMGANYCGTQTGCLGKAPAQSRLAFSAGTVIERRADAAPEAYLRYDLGHAWGPFQPAAGLSVSADGEIWAGFGPTWDYAFGRSGFYTELHAMPGLNLDDTGFDLGGAVAFRSGIEVGYESDGGWRYALSYDHRSNAGLYEDNPGIETVQLRVSVPLK